MQLYYSVYLDRPPGEPTMGPNARVWVQLSDTYPIEPSISLARGRLVALIKEGLQPGTTVLDSWLLYARRCCEAWQALRDTAQLAGVQNDTPPYMLADLAGEFDRPDLEATIRRAYDLPGRCGTMVGAGGVMPPIPPDVPLPWERIEGEGVGT